MRLDLIARTSGSAALRRARVIYQQGLRSALGGNLDAHDVRELRQITYRLLKGLGAWDARRCGPEPSGDAE